MRADKTVNFLMYVAGMVFNLAIMALVGFLVIHAFSWGLEYGNTFANEMVTEGPNYGVEIYLPRNMSVSEVARLLEEHEIIPNRLAFQFEMFLRSISNDYSAGTFMLNKNMNNVEINRALRGTRPPEFAPHIYIRIPEGWTIRDMGAYFEERGFFTAEEFIYVAQYGHFRSTFLLDVPVDRPNRLEGYLFPATYQIPVNPNPGHIITRMIQAFEDRFTEDMHYRAEELNMTVDEVIIKASIIEREARLASERDIVSQIIHSRLRQNMRLEMCSTVKYAMDEPPPRLLNVHLAIDTPYNTYMHSGLPIGPIANPGEAAIRAALWPADTNYLFMVLRDEATGAHHFSRTGAEHNAARDRYLAD